MGKTKSFIEETETVITQNEDGKEISRTTKQTTRKTVPNGEPDFIKIYISAWVNSNQIPVEARNLFLEIALRMSYADPNDYEGGQIVYLMAPAIDEIMGDLGIGKSQFYSLLKKLIDVNAIRKIRRGVYQISPRYAGRGEWKFNPKLTRGGIENIVPNFAIDNGEAETTVVWADDGENNDFNDMYRKGLDVSETDETVLKETRISQQRPEEKDLTDEKILNRKTVPKLSPKEK